MSPWDLGSFPRELEWTEQGREAGGGAETRGGVPRGEGGEWGRHGVPGGMEAEELPVWTGENGTDTGTVNRQCSWGALPRWLGQVQDEVLNHRSIICSNSDLWRGQPAAQPAC